MPLRSQRFLRERTVERRARHRILREHQGDGIPEKKENSEEALLPKTYPIDVRHEGEDHIFGVQIGIKNLKTKEERYMRSRSGDPIIQLGPGTYEAYTEASQKGFPQEAKYQIIDAKTGNIIEEFAKTHVPLTNILLEEGQFLRIIVVPSVRPYNAVFFRLGSRRTPAAFVVARPYPSYEYDVGQYNGNEQFPNMPIALAFFGKKLAEENPEEARRIETLGVPSLRAGQRIHDPVLVFGISTLAEHLTEEFAIHRFEHSEGYRSHEHIGFLVERTPAGRIPPSLLTLDRKTLKNIFEEQLLWMMFHNVHRANEGGGYAGKTFLEDLEEAKEKMPAWPKISFESTERLSEALKDGEDRDTLIRFIRAIRREKMNYASFPSTWLQEVKDLLGKQTLNERKMQLTQWEKNALEKLKKIAPDGLQEL
jgi:hypothetical protein